MTIKVKTSMSRKQLEEKCKAQARLLQKAYVHVDDALAAAKMAERFENIEYVVIVTDRLGSLKTALEGSK